MSTEPTRIYGMADVADLLGVSRAAASNYRRRHDDTPAPDLVTTEGRVYWFDLAEWHTWDARRNAAEVARAERAAELARRRAAEAERRVAELADRAGTV